MSLICAVRRSASRRELAKIKVVRCCSMRSTSCSSMCGQMEDRPTGSSDGEALDARSAMSSTGTRICRSQSLGLTGFTMVAGRSCRRNSATVSTGLTVADRPIRCAGRSRSRSSRSRDRARCAPRLVPAIACTSSMMTVSMPVSASRIPDVIIKNSDSGVVIRMSGGRRACRARSAGGVSPVRIPIVISVASRPSRPASRWMPTRGLRRLRSMSAASALSGET